jgi:hypothetical protein
MIPPLDANQIYGPTHLNQIGQAVNVFNSLYRSRQQPSGTQYGSNHGVIWVKNSSGADRSRFESLTLGAPITTVADGESPFLQQEPVALIGTQPADAAFRTPWAVLLEDIPNGKLGQALRAGITIARVNVANSAHRRVHMTRGSCVLQSGFAGQARLIWCEARVSPYTTGEQWAIVEFDGNPAVKLHGKTGSGGIAEGTWNAQCTEFTPGSAAVTIYEWDDQATKYKRLLDASSNAVTQTVRNDVDEAVGANKLIAILSDDDGVFSPVVEGCNEGCEA